MRAQHVASPFVKPFGRVADGASVRAASFNAEAEHLHAVGHLRFGLFVHRLAAARAPQMRKARSRNKAARRLGGMIEWREKPPLGLATVNGVVAFSGPLCIAAREFAE